MGERRDHPSHQPSRRPDAGPEAAPEVTPEQLTATYLPLVHNAPTVEHLQRLTDEIRRRCATWVVDCYELYAAIVARRLTLLGIGETPERPRRPPRGDEG